MAIKSLQPLFHPTGIAVIGGSDHPGTVGRTVIDNLDQGGFSGPIYAVNVRRIEHPQANWVDGVERLPAGIDLAIICTPAATVPALIAQLGRKKIKLALVLTGGLTEASGLRESMLEAARRFGVRIIGPNSIGLQLPHAHLNASFSRGKARPGGLALISQSGAIATGLVDWAGPRGVGFSAVISTGDSVDVDIADLIDLFATDDRTHAILLHLEGISGARRFLSAARAASRRKPVIALKAGRSDASAKAALTHTGALAGQYDICCAALERAGVVLVDSLTELFAAAEILDRAGGISGNRLGLITNGGGAAVLALDNLAQAGATLAVLQPDTIARLEAILPSGWSRANPVDLLGDADVQRYDEAIRIVEADPGVDALLVMNCPIGLIDGAELSCGVAQALARSAKPSVACWLGGDNFTQAADDFAAAGIASFAMPETAIAGITYLLRGDAAAHARRSAVPPERQVDRNAALRLIQAARSQGRTLLSEVEGRALLSLFQIPVVPGVMVATPEEIGAACANIVPPYAVKIVSPQGIHKSDIGGVALNLADAAAAQKAGQAMAAALTANHPDVAVGGFLVETMLDPAGCYEIALGIADDPIFGPVIMVGAGGKAVEIIRDRAFDLPPLDARFARAMLDRTRISRLLRGYRDVPPVAVDAIVDALCALSAVATELPDILEIDINPLRVDAGGAMALDVRVRISEKPVEQSRLVLPISPAEWRADLVTRAGEALRVRPATPDDEAALRTLFEATATQDLCFRFGTGRSLPTPIIAAMVDTDYDRAITFLAIRAEGAIVAAATILIDADGEEADVALSVREDCRARGISWTLMQHVLNYLRARGVVTTISHQSADNLAAVRLEREIGFTVRETTEDGDLTLAKANS